MTFRLKPYPSVDQLVELSPNGNNMAAKATMAAITTITTMSTMAKYVFRQSELCPRRGWVERRSSGSICIMIMIILILMIIFMTMIPHGSVS